jgi:hypothetical protein
MEGGIAMRIDRMFFATSLVFALIGMALGQYMGLSGRHGQHVTHAHVLLVGFVISIVHAVSHRLWLQDVSSRWARLHYALHTLGAAGMAAGLWAMFGGVVGEAQAGPFLGLSGLLVMAAVAMSLAQVWRSARATPSS